MFQGSAGTKPTKERPINVLLPCFVSFLWLCSVWGCLFCRFPSFCVWVIRAQRMAKAAPTREELVLVAGLGRDVTREAPLGSDAAGRLRR